MRSYWITTILVGFLSSAECRTLFAAEVQHVQLGSTVTLSCNISYIFDTTWFKHNPDRTPTVVHCTKWGRGDPGCQFSPRYTVSLTNRTLALRIAGVEERDLGLYYCIGIVNARLTVGRGTVLGGSSRLPFHHWYCVGVGSGLLIMALAVCTTHWRTKNKKTTNGL